MRGILVGQADAIGQLLDTRLTVLQRIEERNPLRLRDECETLGRHLDRPRIKRQAR